MVAQVLLCDQSGFSRMGLRAALVGCRTVEVIAEVGSGQEALSVAARLHPDVVLADMSLPDLDGVELARQVLGTLAPRAAGWNPSVVLMASQPSDVVLRALRAGATGIVSKDCLAEELIQAIAVILAGGGFLAPSIVRHLFNRMTEWSNPTVNTAAVNRLTRREREVLGLVADGLSNSEISERLYVGEPTVKYHISQVLRKLSLRDRLQAAVFAYKNGLVGWA
jgi:DNA-binding NarL/FixJ family response regulator